MKRRRMTSRSSSARIATGRHSATSATTSPSSRLCSSQPAMGSRNRISTAATSEAVASEVASAVAITARRSWTSSSE